MKNTWKTTVSMLLVLGCTANTAPAIATPVQSASVLQSYGAATQFQDVPSNAWFYSDVAKVVDMGWMRGTSATAFKPNDKLTNAQILQIISNLGAKDASDECPDYCDLPTNAWYYNIAVKYGAYLPARWNKYIGKQQLFPDDPITRAYFAYAMLRSLGLSDSDILDLYEELTGESSGSFGWRYYPRAALAVMNKAGIISGYPNGDLGEDDPLTRAQCAAILNRLLQAELLEETQNNSGRFTQQQLQEICRSLGVPDTLDVIVDVGEPSYWEAAQRWTVPISVFHDGTQVAGASVDSKTGELLRNISGYNASAAANVPEDVTNDVKASNQISAMEQRIEQENVFASCMDYHKIFTRENWRVYEDILLDSLADRKWYNMRAIGTYVGKQDGTFVDMYDVTQSDFESWMNYYYGADATTPPAAGLYQNGVYRALNSQGFIGDTIQITKVYSLGDGKYYVQFHKTWEGSSGNPDQDDHGPGYAVLHWANDHYQVYELGWDFEEISDSRLAYHLAS